MESIGDMLSLFESGIKNVLVTFGLDVSSQLITQLMGLNLKRIVFSFNNDAEKEENRGKNAAIKNYLKLLNHFNQERLLICLPQKNDFGDMSRDDIQEWEKKKEKNKKLLNDQCNLVLNSADSLLKDKKLSKKLHNNIKKLPCYE